MSSTYVASQWIRTLNAPLSEVDPELHDIMEHEKRRQRVSLALIASENYTSRAVYDALGSMMSNKYSEGYPGVSALSISVPPFLPMT